MERSAKPLLPVANRPMLQYVLQWVEQADIRHTLVVVHPKHSQRVANFLNKVYEPLCADTRLELVALDTAEHGTAEAVRGLKDHLKVINS